MTNKFIACFSREVINKKFTLKAKKGNYTLTYVYYTI